MSVTEQQIISSALALPQELRATLVEQLLASLESMEDQAEIDAAWMTEVEARIDAYDRGELKTIPAEQVFRELELPDVR